MLYKVNEIFYSIQGEGRWTGRPAIFIRFAGCNRSCDYCDTKHEKYMKVSLENIITFLGWWAPHDKNGTPIPMVVLTGGEPTIQDLKPLVKMLRDKSWYIALETNGTQPDKIPYRINWLTVSPKLGVNYAKWNKAYSALVNEVKVIFDSTINPNEFKRFIRASCYYIQPMSGDIEPAVEFVKENPEWMLSVQVQKLINIK